MCARIEARGIEVHLNHTLQALTPNEGDRVALTFRPVFARQSCHSRSSSASLHAVRGLPEDIRTLLNSVIAIRLLKCFFVVRNPWWHENTPNRGIGGLPTREMHYYRQADRGNVMVYADRPCINFWCRYVQAGYHDRAEINRDPELPLAFARQMKIDPATILAYGIRDWTRDPYGGAGHLWRPGVEPWKVSAKLEAFS